MAEFKYKVTQLNGKSDSSKGGKKELRSISWNDKEVNMIFLVGQKIISNG